MEVISVPSSDFKHEPLVVSSESSNYNISISEEVLIIAEKDRKVKQITRVNEKLKNDALALKELHPDHAEFINSLYIKLLDSSMIDKEQDVSELAMRSIQSLIVDTLFNMLQVSFPKNVFQYHANQTVGSGKKPDNFLSFVMGSGEEKRTFPLLIGEDKADHNKNDFKKAVELASVETRQAVTFIAHRAIQNVPLYGPILYITCGFYFSFHRFQKIIENTGQFFKTKDNKCTLIKLAPEDGGTYRLDNIKHLYDMILAVSPLLDKTVSMIISTWNLPVVNRNVLKSTPKKSSLTHIPSILNHFTIENQLYVFRYTVSSLCYYSVANIFYAVKYVDEKEVALYQTANQLSPITVPGKVLQFTLELPKPFAIVMEFGLTINEVPFAFEVVDDMFARLLMALQSLHAGRFIHRDIKPSNLILLSSKLHLIDFGLSVQFVREVDDVAYILDENSCEIQLNEYAGTSSFMAPEILEEKPYGAKVDCFGCGMAMLYILGKVEKDPFKTRDDYLTKRHNFFSKHDRCAKYQPIIEGLLTIDPVLRMSASTAYSQFCALQCEEPTKYMEMTKP